MWGLKALTIMTDRHPTRLPAATVAGDEVVVHRIIAAHLDEMHRLARYVARDEVGSTHRVPGFQRLSSQPGLTAGPEAAEHVARPTSPILDLERLLACHRPAGSS